MGFLNNTSCEIGFMKRHIESEHMNILITYVVNFFVASENMPSLEKWNGGSNMEPNHSRNVQS